MIKVFLTGRVTRDPKGGTSQAGTSWARFSIASDDGFGDKKKTTFIDVMCFKGTADFVMKNIKQGTALIVTGKLEGGKYTAPDGTEKKTMGVFAENIEFQTGNPKGGQVAAATATAPEAAAAPAETAAAATAEEDPWSKWGQDEQ